MQSDASIDAILVKLEVAKMQVYVFYAGNIQRSELDN